MPNILSTSLTGMIAFQRALETTGHNIANANTPGYSRQVTEFSARPGQGVYNGYIGSGTQISSIKRVYDEIIGGQLQTSTTSHARFAALNDLASRLDTLIADPSSGLNNQLQSFFNSVQDIANDPSSLPTRSALLGEADSLVLRFSEMDRQFADLDAEISQRLSAAVTDINQLSTSIADLNDRITLGQAANGQPPNDLLDQRNLLVRDLATLVPVDSVQQSDGSMNIFIGNGQTLVVGSEARQLTTQGSEFDPTRLEVAYQTSSGTSVMDNRLTGGQLGGLLEFRNQMLDPARQALGHTAQAVALTVNVQNAAGMDLHGNLGGDFFGIGDPGVTYSNRNTGSGTAEATIADLGAVTGRDYILSYDGASYSMMRADTREAVTMTGSGSAGDPLVADGLSIVTGGAPAVGDRIMIKSSMNGAETITRTMEDAQQIAMAGPTRTLASLSNTGNGSISATEVVDRNDPALLDTAVIQFTGPATYSVNGAGSFAYVSGEPIVVNGSQFTISGTPQAGYEFSLEANSGASGDNRNGLLLANVQAQGILNGGTTSINDSYGQLIGQVGSATRQVQMNFDAQSVVMANAEASQLAKSGVNLDEEAANLLKYQQAYQAMAHVVSVANSMFDTLISATRR
ncbi:MAG: flagellar hook-associated protein FlgK [Woeseia sp.]